MPPPKMQVLYVEQTGHVVAAFTRAAAPESLFDVKAVAGTDLLVRNAEHKLPAPQSGGETLLVPMDLLKADIVELNEDALVMPFNFMVGGGQANDLASAVLPKPPTLSRTDIKISVTSLVPQETKVWAQVQQKSPAPDNKPIVMIVSGSILVNNPPSPPGSDGTSTTLLLTPRPGDEPASIPIDDYYVLVLVAGRPALFSTIPKAQVT